MLVLYALLSVRLCQFADSTVRFVDSAVNFAVGTVYFTVNTAMFVDGTLLFSGITVGCAVVFWCRLSSLCCHVCKFAVVNINFSVGEVNFFVVNFFIVVTGTIGNRYCSL
jgi:hypothetical protein